MKSSRKSLSIDRREFLATTGTGLLAASMPNVARGANFSERSGAVSSSAATASAQGSSGSMRKIPIGVCDPVYKDLSLVAMLDRVSALGLEAMEIGTGGYPGPRHCPVRQLLVEPRKCNAGEQ